MTMAEDCSKPAVDQRLRSQQYYQAVREMREKARLDAERLSEHWILALASAGLFGTVSVMKDLDIQLADRIRGEAIASLGCFGLSVFVGVIALITSVAAWRKSIETLDEIARTDPDNLVSRVSSGDGISAHSRAGDVLFRASAVCFLAGLVLWLLMGIQVVR